MLNFGGSRGELRPSVPAEAEAKGGGGRREEGHGREGGREDGGHTLPRPRRHLAHVPPAPLSHGASAGINLTWGTSGKRREETVIRATRWRGGRGRAGQGRRMGALSGRSAGRSMEQEQTERVKETPMRMEG